MHVYKIRKWRPTQWTAVAGSAVNSFIDQGKFEAMKTLSGHRAPHCGKHQFRAKIMANT